MNALLKKLNFKNQTAITVLNPPENFAEQLEEFNVFLNVKTDFDGEKISFCLLFVTEQQQVNLLAPKINVLLKEDGLFWWAYPKGTSKRFKSNINRDSGWQIMGDLNYEPVRMVAIDEDWSAFRFRKATHIKKMTRDQASRMSEEGKNKI